MKTIRFKHPLDGKTHLGLLHEENVYSITAKVPQWTDPLAMWYALRAFDISTADAQAKFVQGESIAYADLAKNLQLLPPVVAPEVWASGVTYERSRNARNAETKISESVYDRVYEAERPELFFKATYDRVVAPGHPLTLRSDSSWMVPEPEVSVVMTKSGDIVGWTIGDDLSSRDIEGENPLYLPQAKVFRNSCSFGPILLWNDEAAGNPSDWVIHLNIVRNGASAYQDSVPFTQFRRTFDELIMYLRRDNPIPDGTVLMTGTGLVPPDDFTLQAGDVVHIEIAGMGVLQNPITSPST